MKKILVLHGPNLNLLGSREPDVYGRNTLDEINNKLTQQAQKNSVSIAILQSNAEYVLVRASRYVQLGELETAVDELDKLSGQPAFVVADWKKNAIDRINVEKALKVIKMECALLNESCLE